MSEHTKLTNPKDSIGVLKVALSYVSAPVLLELALGMMEGGHKYRRHNYRWAGVRASIYYDATMRHLMAWWEGEDIDKVSRLSHITKAISSLMVLRDAMIFENWTDDRPPAMPPGWIEKYNEHAKWLAEEFKNPKPPYTQATLKDEGPRPGTEVVAPMSAVDDLPPMQEQEIEYPDYVPSFKRRGIG